ncbi:exocyst complex component SEC8 [Elaeis guineensis]|uniref:exocyst complex component SEC8 n=1 Tax=Elaeis guineensis var. tenera TaxID=51953 RepID=UPI003C6DAE6E
MMSSGRSKGIFDGLPIPADKSYLREGLSRIDEGWAAARFDSLPHVVHILTSKDREGEMQFLKEQSDLIEDIVDEVVHSYHHGFNKAIQNYSHILRLFSESAESISVLKVDMAEAKKLLGSRNKQLHQLWYRSLTLRHILSLLDQVEGVAKVPARIEKLIIEKQLYAAVQLLVQSTLMLEREGLQVVGALQDVRSELTKLRGVLFYKVLEDLHNHLYNKGEFSSTTLSIPERDDEIPTTTAIGLSVSSSQPLSRRTRSLKGDNHIGGPDGSFRPGSVDGSSSFDGHDDESTMEVLDGGASDGVLQSLKAHAGDGHVKTISRQIPTWLSYATPDEFLESMKKSNSPTHVKYLHTLVECLCMLGKVAAAGAMICQRLRSTIHDVITSKIKEHAALNSSRSCMSQVTRTATSDLYYSKGLLDSYQVLKQKHRNGTSSVGTQVAISPVSSAMTPMGTAQSATSELLSLILDSVIRILENHIIVGELLESKSSQQGDSINTPKSISGDPSWNPDSESSQVTGGFSVGFSLTVIQSECQQLICEVLRATPEAATADAAVQTARLANKAPVKEKRQEWITLYETIECCTVPNRQVHPVLTGGEPARFGWFKRWTNAPCIFFHGYFPGWGPSVAFGIHSNLFVILFGCACRLDYFEHGLPHRLVGRTIPYCLAVSHHTDTRSSFDGHDDESTMEVLDGGASDGVLQSLKAHAGDGHVKTISRQIPTWLSYATPDEFLESMKKSNSPTHVKYLHTLVECLCMLGKVAAAGAMICQRLRSTIHDVITSKIKEHAALNSSRSCMSQVTRTATSDLYYSKGLLDSYQVLKQKHRNGTSSVGTQVAISPVSSAMTPMGTAQSATSELLSLILDSVIRILENHIIVGELLESKSSQQGDSINTPKSISGDPSWNPDSESSQVTGGFSVGFSLTVIQSECQQLICEVLRATPEAATADAAVQTARLANKAPVKEKRDGSEGLSFAFRFTDAAVSMPNQGVGQGWRRVSNVQQEGYGTAAVLPDQGIYLAASVYRPVLQFTDKIASMLPNKYSQLGNDGLLAFVENFLKDHFLPAMFVDYRKCVQQAISSPAAFRPRAHAASVYSPLVEKGRPVLQGLVATDFLAKEVLGWAHLMPKYAGELVEYVQTFLERAHERCRTAYMEAVLEKQSYMLIGRNDVESLMRLDPANAYLRKSSGQPFLENNVPDAETVEVEIEMSDLLLSLRPIKQENLIRDDHKLILLASLSDSLECLADSIERLGESFVGVPTDTDEKVHTKPANRRERTTSAIPKNLASIADEYKRLAIDCLKVLRLEMQLETIFHMQEMSNREYVEDQDAEEPDDFIISLTAQITRWDEEIAPFVEESKRNYIFGGICSVAASASVKALAEMKSINLLGVQQICRNSIALEQALAAIPPIDNEAVQQRLDRVRTYYELLNLPFEALLAFITEHEYLFTAKEYSSLLKISVPGREIPADAEQRLSEILSQ